jgi:S-adenosyl methyltransferase
MTAGEGFRPDIPSTARMYDYYLGGKDNFAADRKAANRAIAMMPHGVVRTSAMQNRKFLMRSVRHLAGELGVRQFLDIGTGLPTMNNVHEVAQAIAPESRVVYVDHDPSVITHGRALLQGNDRAAIIERDARDPASILADPTLRALLDFGQPIAVLLVAVLHFIRDDEDPYGIVRALMSAVPAGSFLVISHFTADSYPRADQAARVYNNASASLHSRTRDQVAEFFDGYDLIAPGEIVWTPQWRPDPATGLAAEPGDSLFWCGVGRKSGPAPPGALPAAAAAEPDPGRLAGRRAGRRAVWSHGQGAATPDPRFSPDVPNIARMYDYFLGGKDNYPADRAAAQEAFTIATEAVIRGSTLENRKFLGRAVRYLARDLGIRQFLDIGTGLPTMNNVHEVAHAVAPDASVVYVDNDPIVIAHARDMLNGVPNTAIIHGDLRDPAAILADPVVRARLDFGKPIALLLVAVLHFIADDEDPWGIVRALMSAVPPGSYLVISHVTADRYTHVTGAARVYDESSAGIHFRTRAEVEAMLAGLPLVDPGELVWVHRWHPDKPAPAADPPGGASVWCGIARK